MTHSYINPSDHVDTSGVESGVSKGEVVNEHGFTVRAPISAVSYTHLTRPTKA